MLVVFPYLYQTYVVVFYATLVAFCITLPIPFLTSPTSRKRIFFYSTSLMFLEVLAIGFIYLLARGIFFYFLVLDSWFFFSFLVFFFLFFSNALLLLSFYRDKERALALIAAYKQRLLEAEKEEVAQHKVDITPTDVLVERPVGVGVRTPFGGFLDTPPPEPLLPPIVAKATETKE